MSGLLEPPRAPCAGCEYYQLEVLVVCQPRDRGFQVRHGNTTGRAESDSSSVDIIGSAIKILALDRATGMCQ